MPNSISGTAFRDLNSNELQDAQETGIGGVEIQLIDSDNEILETATTDESGFYEFTDVDAGSYVVRQIVPDGFDQTSPTFASELIEQGEFQTPVDIRDAETVDLGDVIDIEYDGEGPEALENGGSNFEIIYEAGNDNFIELNGDQFELVNFHFHSDSEHAIDGELEEMELHLVHQNTSGGLTVLGVLIETGEFDESEAGSEFTNALAPVFDTVSSELEVGGSLPETVSLSEEIDLEALLPSDESGWYYNGALTTPPFSEGVNWFVFEETLTLSVEQMEIFQAYLESVGSESNNRELQPLNGRQFNELNHQLTIDDESVGNLDFGNFPENQILGTADDDVLIGDSAGNILFGRQGDDILLARQGNDTIGAGNGDDIALGGSGDDRIRGGNGDDLLAGGQGNDVLNGGEGDDRIRGAAGDDRLIGGSGGDTLVGGQGSDQFIYTEIADAVDVIRDFQVGQDQIVLRRAFRSLGLNNLSYQDAIDAGNIAFGSVGRDTTVLIDADGLGGEAPQTLVSVRGVSVADLNDASNFSL